MNGPHYLKNDIAYYVGTAHVKKGIAFLFIDDNEGIFMVEVEEIKKKYPGADAWQMGDSPELANELADLIKKGIKTASCESLPLTSRKIRRESGVITLFLMVRMFQFA